MKRIGTLIRTLVCLLILFPHTFSLHAQVKKDTSFILYFDSDVYKPNSSQTHSLINFLSSVDGISSIIGYADTVGTIGHNRNLSRLRALCVYQIISKQRAMEISYSFKGEEFPQNADLNLNRKVEILAYKFVDIVKSKVNSNAELIDSFNIERINFLPDKPILTPESFGSIPYLIDKIKSYKNARFEIIGHINYQSKRDSSHLQDLYKLSVERARVIYETLIDNGIDQHLLHYKGVGNSQPLIKNPENDEERMKNMRVQILVFRMPK